MRNVIPVLCAAVFLATARATEPLPPISTVTLDDFKLVGELHGERAVFTLSATARVTEAKGGEIELLSGPVALTDLTNHPQWRVRAQQNRFGIMFDHRGKYAIQLKF